MEKNTKDGWNENDTMLPQKSYIGERAKSETGSWGTVCDDIGNVKEWDEWDEPAEKKLTATELYKLEMADRRKDQSER